MGGAAAPCNWLEEGSRLEGADLCDSDLKSQPIIALSPEFPHWPSLRAVITAGAIGQVLGAANGRAVTHPDGSFRWDIPVPDPEKVICAGVSFSDRNAEYKDGQDAPPIRPPESAQLDYEGEIAVVIGPGGRRIPEAQALSHIAGLTLCSEGKIRDWVRHAKFNVTQGKNSDGSGAMGPWLVPFRDPSQLVAVAIKTRVNGEVRQPDRRGGAVRPAALAGAGGPDRGFRRRDRHFA